FSGRDDWHRRVAYFALFGAIGWSFGGSQSYMQVLAYTHSGDSVSVLYGFACLFVIGFLWAAFGGAGTALPACLDRERLTGFFAPMTAVFVAWIAEDLWLEPWLESRGYGLNWFDTDWLGALVAIVAALGWAAFRRRIDDGASLILHMALGWWAGFFVLVVGLGLRMTPPRGDNWSGCLGMFAGLMIYCWRKGFPEVALVALITGTLGGIGFASAVMLKLVEVTSGLETNWHSLYEQTAGLFNGLALATAMASIARRSPRLSDDPPVRRWTDVYAVAFVLPGITYLNLRKNPGTWIKEGGMARVLYGLPPATWFDLAYAALAVAILVPLILHLRRPMPLVPTSWVGKGQLLYLVFLWWMVVGNFDRALVGFAEQRLVTEGVIHLNACLCTLLVLLGAGSRREVTSVIPIEAPARAIGRALWVCSVAAVVAIVVDWAIVRAIYGDRFAGHANLHIRFGPHATVKTGPR
ncbi:MAG TPA: hypothetical protein VGH33_00140, partial [Isosphaeraceae bacterium]